MKKMFKNLKCPKMKFKLPGRKFWFGKKFLISIAVIAAVAVGGAFMFTSIQQNTLYNIAASNIAEARFFMKVAKAGPYDIQLYTGVREEPFVQNGIAGRSVPFVIVNLDGNDSLKDFSQIEASLKCCNETYSIVLLQNPYNPLNFSNDIVSVLRHPIKPDTEVEITLS